MFDPVLKENEFNPIHIIVIFHPKHLLEIRLELLPGICFVENIPDRQAVRG